MRKLTLAPLAPAHRIKKFILIKSFLTCEYCYETVGCVTAQAIEFYIKRCQDKHWKNMEPFVGDSGHSQMTN